MCTFTKNLVFPCQENPYFWLCWVVCCILKGLYFKGKSIKGSHSFFCFSHLEGKYKDAFPSLLLWLQDENRSVHQKSMYHDGQKLFLQSFSSHLLMKNSRLSFLWEKSQDPFQTLNLFQYFSSIVGLN